VYAILTALLAKQINYHIIGLSITVCAVCRCNSRHKKGCTWTEFFSSHEFKAQVSYSDHLLSVCLRGHDISDLDKISCLPTSRALIVYYTDQQINCAQIIACQIETGSHAVWEISKQKLKDSYYKLWSLHFLSENWTHGRIYFIENSSLPPLFRFEILPSPWQPPFVWQETKSGNYWK
jgi:hypothetical protein